MKPRVCIVTGATGGIGRALSKKFKDEGFSLLIAGRSERKLALLKEKLSSAEVETCVYDALQGNERIVVERALDAFGQIDVLINNAGIGIYESFERMREEDLRKVFEVNFFSPWRMTREALKYMGEGSWIINISSITAYLPVPFMGGYGASKSALSSMMESLRGELIERGISVLNVEAGRIKTDFPENTLGTMKHPPLGEREDPVKFVNAVYRAYLGGKRKLIWPPRYRFYILLRKLFPSLYDRKLYKRWKEFNERR
ncbi:MAG: SDR family oxidoreductase [Synergistetes bacterium]|nr:SDR family oxidoreductase [Synergistota bacterium]